MKSNDLHSNIKQALAIIPAAIGANATTKVKRTDFNMGKNVPYVGDEVTIDIALEAVKQ